MAWETVAPCRRLHRSGRGYNEPFYNFYGNPSQSYGAPPAIRDHLPPDTSKRAQRSALTPAKQVSTRRTYNRGMEG